MAFNSAFKSRGAYSIEIQKTPTQSPTLLPLVVNCGGDTRRLGLVMVSAMRSLPCCHWHAPYGVIASPLRVMRSAEAMVYLSLTARPVPLKQPLFAHCLGVCVFFPSVLCLHGKKPLCVVVSSSKNSSGCFRNHSFMPHRPVGGV